MRNFDSAAANVLVIGARKSATSEIVKKMSKYDGVWLGAKEHQFFSVYFNKGTDWYHSQLQRYYKNSTGCDGSVFDNQIVTEKSPNNTPIVESAQRIFEYNLDIKIIVSLRNPVSRAFSRNLYY